MAAAHKNECPVAAGQVVNQNTNGAILQTAEIVSNPANLLAHGEFTHPTIHRGIN